MSTAIKLHDAVDAHLNRLRAIKSGIAGLAEMNSTEARSGLLYFVDEAEHQLLMDIERIATETQGESS